MSEEIESKRRRRMTETPAQTAYRTEEERIDAIRERVQNASEDLTHFRLELDRGGSFDDHRFLLVNLLEDLHRLSCEVVEAKAAVQRMTDGR